MLPEQVTREFMDRPLTCCQWLWAECSSPCNIVRLGPFTGSQEGRHMHLTGAGRLLTEEGCAMRCILIGWMFSLCTCFVRVGCMLCKGLWHWFRCVHKCLSAACLIQHCFCHHSGVEQELKMSGRRGDGCSWRQHGPLRGFCWVSVNGQRLAVLHRDRVVGLERGGCRRLVCVLHIQIIVHRTACAAQDFYMQSCNAGAGFNLNGCRNQVKRTGKPMIDKLSVMHCTCVPARIIVVQRPSVMVRNPQGS